LISALGLGFCSVATMLDAVVVAEGTPMVWRVRNLYMPRRAVSEEAFTSC
jgi:hypothetical protein